MAEDDPLSARYPNGKFRPGNSASPGRPAGPQNKVGKLLRDCIRGSAERHGRDGRGEGGLAGFFNHLAHTRPKEFVQCIAKLVPTADEEETEAVPGITSVEVLAVPSNHFFMSDVTLLCQPDPWLYTSDEVVQLQEIRKIARERAEVERRKRVEEEAKASGKVISIKRGGAA